jgi:hypothetical protein
LTEKLSDFVFPFYWASTEYASCGEFCIIVVSISQKLYTSGLGKFSDMFKYTWQQFSNGVGFDVKNDNCIEQTTGGSSRKEREAEQ